MSHVDALIQRAENVVLKDIFNSKYLKITILPFFIAFDVLKCPFSKVAILHFQFLAATLNYKNVLPHMYSDYQLVLKMQKDNREKCSFRVGKHPYSNEILISNFFGGCRGHNRMVVGFTIAYAISAYHH